MLSFQRELRILKLLGKQASTLAKYSWNWYSFHKRLSEMLIFLKITGNNDLGYCLYHFIHNWESCDYFYWHHVFPWCFVCFSIGLLWFTITLHDDISSTSVYLILLIMKHLIVSLLPKHLNHFWYSLFFCFGWELNHTHSIFCTLRILKIFKLPAVPRWHKDWCEQCQDGIATHVMVPTRGKIGGGGVWGRSEASSSHRHLGTVPGSWYPSPWCSHEHSKFSYTSSARPQVLRGFFKGAFWCDISQHAATWTTLHAAVPGLWPLDLLLLCLI